MPEIVSSGGIWLSVVQIIAIDILLGGDNAVVIALACRRLPEAQRRLGIFWGAVGAIVLRVALTFFALQLLHIPWLKIAGALALLWIGIKLLLPQKDEPDDVRGSTHLLGAIRTIIVADAVMSLDNVVALAGAANGDIVLVALGIAVSIPIIVWGSRVVLHLMERFPVVITLGAALLGWIAGGMLVGDEALSSHLGEPSASMRHIAGAIGAMAVVALGTLLAARTHPRPSGHG